MGIKRPVPHLYTPGLSVIPPMFPAPSSVTFAARPAASVKASSMSLTAVVTLDGVGVA